MPVFRITARRWNVPPLYGSLHTVFKYLHAKITWPLFGLESDLPLGSWKLILPPYPALPRKIHENNVQGAITDEKLCFCRYAYTNLRQGYKSLCRRIYVNDLCLLYVSPRIVVNVSYFEANRTKSALLYPFSIFSAEH